ncbi:hypothetical protein [Aquabacterium sp.]|uniref:hypothetical protein n=1 Tax=Aquabacterium sp. TaxID=1872578 RepID=UPI003BAF4308
MSKITKAQQIVAGVAAMREAGFKFSASVEATASRNYAYYTVTVNAKRGDLRLFSDYSGSTVNSQHSKGNQFANRVATAVQHDVSEQLNAAELNVKANSNIGKALLSIIELFEEEQHAAA